MQILLGHYNGLHQRAGLQGVIELHGNLHHEHCLHCGAADAETPRLEAPYLRICLYCGGWLRPAVTWFGESLPQAALAQAEQAMKTCDLLVVVGTSALVYPAADLPRRAKAEGAKVVLINQEPTEHLKLADAYLEGRAGELLPMLLARP